MRVFRPSCVRCTCLLLLLSVFIPAANASTPIVSLDRIVAVVNDDVILASELDKKIAAVVQRIRESGAEKPPPPALLIKEVLDRLILQRLQLQKAAKVGIQISEERLNQAISTIAEQNQLSLEEFRDILVGDGYDFADFRQSIREELVVAQVKKQLVERRIQVTDREIDEMMATMARQGDENDEYRLGHILISVASEDDPQQRQQARARANEVRRELLRGADFRTTARAVSDGRQAEQGGDLGWRKLNTLPQLFASMATSFSVGEISEIISSDNGFHIITLLEAKYASQHMVDQTHARHILIRTDELTNADTARTRLQQLKQRIEGGDDFFELARSHSDDTSTSIKGGDLGWTNPGELVPAFEAVMNSLEINRISNPFESPFGWHIVQVLGRRNHDNTELVRRNQARNLLKKQKLEEETQAWLRELREDAFVQYRLDGE